MRFPIRVRGSIGKSISRPVLENSRHPAVAHRRPEKSLVSPTLPRQGSKALNSSFPTVKTIFFAFTLVASAGLLPAATLTSSSLEWISLGPNFDFFIDQQTGQASSDIVGSPSDPGFFTTFDDGGTSSLIDGTLAFRVRLDTAGGQNNNPQLDSILWIGIDADGRGDINAFIGVNTQGATNAIELLLTGAGANNSPNSTSIANTPFYSENFSPSTFGYRPVDVAFDGGTTNDLTPTTTGDPDYYASFLIDFSQVVALLSESGIDIDETSPLRYILATSTQTNALNQDLGGIDGNDPNFDPSISWEELDGFSITISANGTIIPEPSVTALLAAVCLGLLKRRKKTA